ncbi:probable pentatricopeptide repeat-containing protein At3g61520, mitochondrial at N-terminal half [Coccomyxa sp. Obi]|nr:probable pentatricopeptide repeat-containing protein At3g61520, mitochondrial at N-terminal half [Coccomyxa sp. Obi]
MSLPDSIAAFSADLRFFAAQTADGINSLRRTVNSKPCIGPTVFRESCKELVHQAAVISSEVGKLQSVTLDAVSLEEVLSHCLALHKDSQRRIVELEGRLRQYGYKAEYCGRVVEEPLAILDSQPEVADAHANVACSMSNEKTEGSRKDWHEERYGTQSPEPLGDLTGKYTMESTSTARQLTITPSPVASSLVSAVSLTPSLRELQRKYAANSGPSGSSKGDQSGSSVMQRDMEQKYGACASTPDVIGRKLAYLALETPGGVLRSSPSQQDPLAKKVDHLALEHPRFSPTNRLAAPEDMHAGALATTVGGQSPRVGTAAAGMSKSAAKKESIATRLAAGEPPWDMLSLKAAIHAALPGTGEVARMISSASFQPQAAAFTSLLHMCAKAKLWQKALEVFQAMRDYHPAVRPNTVHFSSLISACATAGRWEEAMQVFSHMKAAAKSDPACAPNVITYSALMTACCAGARPDKAYEVFRSMRSEDIRPDHISYSTLIAGFERNGDADMARQVYDEMQAAGLQPTQPAPGPPAAKATPFIDHIGRKMKQGGALGSPHHSGGNQQMPPLSPTRAAAAARTPHPSVGHPIWSHSFPGSPKTGGHGQISLQTPGGLGLYDGGTLQQQADNRSGFIPASYGAMYSGLTKNARGGYGVPVEETTLELRKAVLHTRSPSAAFQYSGAQNLPNLDAQTPFLAPAAQPDQAVATVTPHHVINPSRTPSTAELLLAAHSGSTAQLGSQWYALQQQQASQAPQDTRRNVTFASGLAGQVAVESPRKALEGFSLFQSSHLPPPASSRAPTSAPVIQSPFAQHQQQAQQSSSMFGSGADAIMAVGVRPRSFDAAPGSPLSRRTATTHSRANSRSFDAAPGSPLAQRALPDTDTEPQQQVAWNSTMLSHLYATNLSHEASESLQGQLSGSFGLPPSSLNRQASSSIQGQPSGNLTTYPGNGASSLQSQHSAGSNLSRQQSAVSVGPYSQVSGDFSAAAAQHVSHQISHPSAGAFDCSSGGYGGQASIGQSTTGQAGIFADTWADKVAPRAAAAQACASSYLAHATSLQASSTAVAADAPNSVSPEEYARLPLRLSRQLQLGAINEGLAFITRGVEAQLARGFPLDAAGMKVEELDTLCLGHSQKTALLQSLLQLKRLRLIMRDTHRTYTLA